MELLRINYEKHEPIKQYTLTDTAHRDKTIVLEAIEYINPDLDYEGSIKVGTALKNMDFPFSVWDSSSNLLPKSAITQARNIVNLCTLSQCFQLVEFLR